MNLREQKTDLRQPLLEDYMVDINDLTWSNLQAVSQDNKLSNDSTKISDEELETLIKKIESCIKMFEILEPIDTIDPPSTTRSREGSRYQTYAWYGASIFIVSTIWIIVLTVSPPEKRDDNIKMAIYVSSILIPLSLCQYACSKRGRYSSREMHSKSMAVMIDHIHADEKHTIHELAHDFQINLNEITLDNFIKLLKEKKNYLIYKKTCGPCKTAFMMGGDLVYGAKSSVRTLFNNALFDKKVCGLVFQFADFSEIPKKEKADRVTSELMNILFLTHPYNPEKDESIIQEILSYLGLNDNELDAENTALARFAP